MDFYHLTSTTRDFHRKSIEKLFIKATLKLSHAAKLSHTHRTSKIQINKTKI